MSGHQNGFTSKQAATNHKQQQPSTITTTTQHNNQQQLKWRKGKSSTPTTTLPSPQTTTTTHNDIGKSSCIDVVATPSSATLPSLTSNNTQQQQLQSNRNNTSATTAPFRAEDPHDLKLGSLVAATTVEETTPSSTLTTPTTEEGGLSAQTSRIIQISPSPETSRISHHHINNNNNTSVVSNTSNNKLQSASSSSAVSSSSSDKNRSSSLLSFFWSTPPQHSNKTKSDLNSKQSYNKNSTESSLSNNNNSIIHQNLQPDSGSTGAHSTGGMMKSSSHHLVPHNKSNVLTLDVASNSSTADSSSAHEGNNKHSPSFDTSRQVSRTSVATCASSSIESEWHASGPQASFSFDGRFHTERRGEVQNRRQSPFDIDCHHQQRQMVVASSVSDDQQTAATTTGGVESASSSDVSSSPSQLSTDVSPSETGGTATATTDNNNHRPNSSSDHHTQQHRVSTLCQCPCRNCATCPLRVIPQNRGKKDRRNQRDDKSQDSNNQYDEHGNMIDDDRDSDNQSKSLWKRVKTAVVNFCMMEAEDDPSRFKYDVRVIPLHPLPKGKQRLLEITELPFLILWVYFTYWAVIVTMTAGQSPATVWLSAAVAGVLVGIGLNANAYKSVTVPRRRGAVRHHRHARALLELRKYGESIDAMEMKIDWGMVIRFFIIPFGVSSLSGLTNSNRDDFLLVFPCDPYYLMIAILCPAVAVTCLALGRIFLLWRLKVRWSLQVLFLNGALVD